MFIFFTSLISDFFNPIGINPVVSCLDFNSSPSKRQVALSLLPQRLSSNSYNNDARTSTSVENNSDCKLANDRIEFDRIITHQY